MLKIANARAVLDSTVASTNIYIDGGKIACLSTADLPADTVIDAHGRYVAPGFIDTHVHGGGGVDFMGNADDYRRAAALHLAHGTTTLLPTTMAASFEATMRAIRTFQEVAPEAGGKLPNMPGMHLEGPYFSLAQAGAQPPAYIYPPRPSEYRELLAAAEGAILKWSFAPEHEGSIEFCDTLVRAGVFPSIGHTDATYEQVLAAHEHGARCMTHFYSAMSSITRRSGFRVLGVIESGYLLDEMWIEIIGDGCHLPEPLLRMICKLKDNRRIMTITDAIAEAFLPEGVELPGSGHVIEDGVAKMADRICFAGSIASTDRVVRTMVNVAGCDLPTAVRMMTKNPAEFLGLKGKGSLLAGYDADLVFFGDDIVVDTVMLGGKIVE
ncbi:MAG: N-acetylglucosamine-6-phosphate deacetylase [Clostridia bacterium]|nr:N-acetylglucosamine-6-phosphate deacetylase [Clostridia bacterium]